MKIDLYTKGVLTVIAVCLVILVVGQTGVFTPARAATVGGDRIEGTVDVRIVEVGWGASPLPVEVKRFSGSNVPVEVKNSSYNYVPVKVYQ